MTSVALILFVLVPVMANQLANFIPPEGERALGEVTLAQIREAMDETGIAPTRICSSPAGMAALRQIQAWLEAEAALPVEVTVHVLDCSGLNLGLSTFELDFVLMLDWVDFQLLKKSF